MVTVADKVNVSLSEIVGLATVEVVKSAMSSVTDNEPGTVVKKIVGPLVSVIVIEAKDEKVDGMEFVRVP
jgi:hypothetical protein